MSNQKPWYAAVSPHRDIREGHLDESVFAANLWQVVLGKAPDVYLNPELFFQKTYLTNGLQNMLKRVAAGLQGDTDAGDRILSLQTSFGGGKTHTLVALWHLAKNGTALCKKDNSAEVCKLVKMSDKQKPCNVAVFTNQVCDPVQGRTAKDGTKTRTIWGELAYQLGGKELYELVRPNDEAQTTPKGVFSQVLEKAAPCLILIDELADYCCAATGVKVGKATLSDQTISFVQELTEAVQSVPNAVLVATLPASSLEVANSEVGEEILSRLQSRFGRMGADMKPVGDNEIYEVIRKRLFDEIGTEKEIKDVVDTYIAMYRAHMDEVPEEVLREDYREQMMRAYPFHPLLIDALHTRWGSHPDFQRTRGVLRLLAAIVADLWQRRNNTTQSQSLIQPCHLRFDMDALIGQVTRLWGANYQTVIASDIIGKTSNAEKLDSSKGGEYASERIVGGAAASVLLGSFGSGAENKGWTSQEIKLACSRPDLNWNFTDSALAALKERAFYLRSTSTQSVGERYWFDVKPTLNKLLVQYRQSVEQTTIDQTIADEVKKCQRPPAGTFPRLLINPSTDLPEQKELTLLLLDPEHLWDEKHAKSIEQKVLKISKKCGSKDRLYRNTLLFLAPLEKGYKQLEDQVRDLVAYQRIKEEYGSQLETEEVADIRDRIVAWKEKIDGTIGTAYCVALRVGKNNEIETVKIPNGKSSFAEHLQSVWSQMKDEEWIISSVGSTVLKEAGMWPEEGKSICLKDATEAFLRFTDKPILSDNAAVARGVGRLCQEKLIGIAYGSSPEDMASRQIGVDVMPDPFDDAVWLVASYKEVSPEAAAGSKAMVGESPSVSGKTLEATQTVPAGAMGYKKVRIYGKVPLEHFADVFSSFIRPLIDHKPQIEISIEASATGNMVIDGKKIDQGGIKEAASQLGLSVETD